MYDLYFPRDQKRGLYRTFLWFIEEVGELSTALNQDNLNKPTISEEMADIIAWLTSLANLLEIDLEKALKTKYPNKCLKCGHKPCICESG
ncbi:MAG: MazG nucleotide pyrophosphohydrolase domain protein [Promethearchaeota archaeon]|nr:MAG: MazG nucleotide pyrophosphohydrolase domain protein [Candidatus Lokiarchaeota archaeon]